MARVVLHIGTHKTASTTIQEVFSDNAETLRRFGVFYPKLPYRHSGHHGLVTEWGSNLPRTYHLNGSSRKWLRKIAKAHEAEKGTVLLSSEEFSRADAKQRVDLNAIKQIFSGYESISVICVLKPQWRLLQSLYAEISKRTSPERPPLVVREATESGQFQGLFLNYLDLFEWLTSVFEPNQVHFLDYMSVKNSPRGIVGSVLEVLRAQEAHGALRVADRWCNPSPKPLAQWMANLLAEPDPPTASLVHRVETLFPNSRPQCLFTRSEVRQIQSAFEESNAKLGARIPGFRISGQNPDQHTVFREDIGADIWQRLAGGLSKEAGY